MSRGNSRGAEKSSKYSQCADVAAGASGDLATRLLVLMRQAYGSRGKNTLPSRNYLSLHRPWAGRGWCKATSRRLRQRAPPRASPSSSPRPRAHPRWRGEYRTSPTARYSRRGSPPLARGIHQSPHRRRSQRGLTPAGAGNTRLIPASSCARSGSPPLARGILSPLRDSAKHCPAHPRWRGEYTS